MAGTVKSSSTTKSGEDVIKTLRNNATIDASQSGGTAKVAKGTDSQTAIENLITNYTVQAKNANADTNLTDSALSASGAVSGDLAYANYLTANRPSGANTYAQYLASLGQSVTDSEKTRASSVAEANKEYAKALSTYGQTGEQLARSGLSNSGYADYLRATAYASNQTAKLSANATKTATDINNRLGYAQYLQTYDENMQNKMLTVLEYTTQLGMTKDQAVTYAKSIGLDDTMAESIGKAQDAYIGATGSASTDEVNTQATTLYTSLYDEDSGLTYTPANKSIYEAQWKAMGYSDEAIATAVEKLDSVYNATVTANYDLYRKAITDNNAVDKIGLSYYGSDVWGAMSASEKSTAIDKLIAQDSTLTDDQKADWYVECLDAKVADGQTTKDIMNELLSLQGSGMSEKLYNKIEQAVADKYISYSGGKYYFNGAEVEWSGANTGSTNVIAESGSPAGNRRLKEIKAELNIRQLKDGEIYYDKQRDTLCLYRNKRGVETIYKLIPDLGTSDFAYGLDADESVLTDMLKSYIQVKQDRNESTTLTSRRERAKY